MVMTRFKAIARNRGLEWSLTDEQFNTMIGSICFYCGVGPSSVQCAKWTNMIFSYNGIDRVDNALGYTFGNTLTCCKLCSHAKAGMAHNEFIEYLIRAGNHQKNWNIMKAGLNG